ARPCSISAICSGVRRTFNRSCSSRSNRISAISPCCSSGSAFTRARASSRRLFIEALLRLRSLPLLPQLCPVFQPLPDLALEAALGRIVEGVAAERLREVVLAGEGVGGVVVVLVASAVALRLHQLGRCVEDVLGRQQRARLLGGAHGRAIGGIGGV